MKCPKCETELQYNEKFLDEQTLYIAIGFQEGAMLQLSTVGDVMSNFSMLLKATAKEVNRTANVYLKSFEITKTTVKIGVLIIEKEA